jgi:hypothetical protein
MYLLIMQFFSQPLISSSFFGPNVLNILYSKKCEIQTKISYILQVAINSRLSLKERLGMFNKSHNNDDSKHIYSLP